MNGGSMLVVMALAACVEDKTQGDTSAPDLQPVDTAPVVCDGTNPTLEQLVIEPYDGLYPYEHGDAPALKVSATGSDPDGDINNMNLVVWFDAVVDGTVDTSGAGQEAGYYKMGEPCDTFGGTYSILFEVDGDRFAYDTAYEFSAVVWDAAGLVSDPVVASGTTPNADGTHG